MDGGEIMKMNPVGWFEIYVADMSRARKFYENVLSVSLQKMESPDQSLEMWGFPMDHEAAGASGALAKMSGVSPGGGGTLIYFNCEDCNAASSRAMKAGGKIHRPKMPIGEHGFIALAVDTEGNMIGLHSMK
jgi:predicted enzyme related to lactoylglutathione lyase